jgi:hypothetical protein
VSLGPEASCSIPVATRQVREGRQTGYSGLDVLQWSRQLLLFGSSGWTWRPQHSGRPTGYGIGRLSGRKFNSVWRAARASAIG